MREYSCLSACLGSSGPQDDLPWKILVKSRWMVVCLTYCPQPACMKVVIWRLDRGALLATAGRQPMPTLSAGCLCSWEAMAGNYHATARCYTCYWLLHAATRMYRCSPGDDDDGNGRTRSEAAAHHLRLPAAGAAARRSLSLRCSVCVAPRSKELLSAPLPCNGYSQP
ncbi:hypothetical protein Dimus_025005 [Dionaea muscipula]